MAPEAVAYYREAIASYEKVFEAKGADTPVGHLLVPLRLRRLCLQEVRALDS